jgi:pyruvate-ferredoxin/flavodoxin oxidoreductase
LDLENLEAAPTAKKPAPQPKPKQEDAEEASAEEKKEEPPQEEEEDDLEVSAEMWIETMRCTSCNDCTDQLPEVFEYNEEKQAVIKDPNGAPYPRIVEIAENCPAKCIHPGLPDNPDDPEMQKWIKRAEPLN